MSEYRLQARLSETAHLDIITDSLPEMAKALVFFKLAEPNPAEQAQSELPLEAPAPVAEEPKAKKTRKPAATQPAAETAPEAPVVAEPATESPSEADEGNAVAESTKQETPAASTASSAASATPAEAAEAVRAYGAKKGIVAARELLQKFGFAKTADITADKAGAVVEAAQV